MESYFSLPVKSLKEGGPLSFPFKYSFSWTTFFFKRGTY